LMKQINIWNHINNMRHLLAFEDFIQESSDKPKGTAKLLGYSRIDGCPIYSSQVGDDRIFYKQTLDGIYLIRQLTDELSSTDINKIFSYDLVEDPSQKRMMDLSKDYWVPETKSMPGYHTKKFENSSTSDLTEEKSIKNVYLSGIIFLF